MNDKSTIIEKLLSKEENVPKISDWVSCTEDGGGAMAMHSYGHEELKEILTSLPEEKFKELLRELDVDVDDTTIPPPHGYQHQSLEDDFAAPGTALVVDPNNVPMLPPAHGPGRKECADCLEKKKEISELKDRCKLLEKKVRSSQAAIASCRCEIWENIVKNLKMERQNAQESQEQAASDWKRKGQIMAEKNKDMEKQVMAMGRQIKNLNAQIENTLQALQEKSEGDKKEHLRIINYFRQVMGERKKKIEELEAENQMLQNKEPPDQNGNWCELHEKLMKLGEEQSQLEVQMKTNSELLAGAIKNNEELKQENQLLKEGMEEKEEEFRTQLAIQAASYASREADIARKVNEEVCKLQEVYEDLIQFATTQGILNLFTLNNETE